MLVRCGLCRRRVRYLAADLAELLGGAAMCPSATVSVLEVRHWQLHVGKAAPAGAWRR